MQSQRTVFLLTVQSILLSTLLSMLLQLGRVQFACEFSGQDLIHPVANSRLLVWGKSKEPLLGEDLRIITLHNAPSVPLKSILSFCKEQVFRVSFSHFHVDCSMTSTSRHGRQFFDTQVLAEQLKNIQFYNLTWFWNSDILEGMKYIWMWMHHSQNMNNKRPQGTKAVWRRVLRQFSACGSLDFENLRARTATLS